MPEFYEFRRTRSKYRLGLSTVPTLGNYSHVWGSQIISIKIGKPDQGSCQKSRTHSKEAGQLLSTENLEKQLEHFSRVKKFEGLRKLQKLVGPHNKNGPSLHLQRQYAERTNILATVRHASLLFRSSQTYISCVELR